jgi:hypothetical protein
MSNINLNKLRDKAYKMACEHGFHNDILSNEHYLTLVITELSESVEADRKGKRVSKDDLPAYNLCQKDKFYMYAFENYIKDTVEDELADVVIRLLDLYGLKNIFLDESGFDEENILDYASFYEDKSFTEGVYYITGLLADKNNLITESCVLPEMLLLEIFGFAKHLDVDLDWYIEQKMKYNSYRTYKHNKNY